MQLEFLKSEEEARAKLKEIFSIAIPYKLIEIPNKKIIAGFVLNDDNFPFTGHEPATFTQEGLKWSWNMGIPCDHPTLYCTLEDEDRTFIKKKINLVLCPEDQACKIVIERLAKHTKPEICLLGEFYYEMISKRMQDMEKEMLRNGDLIRHAVWGSVDTSALIFNIMKNSIGYPNPVEQQIVSEYCKICKSKKS